MTTTSKQQSRDVPRDARARHGDLANAPLGSRGFDRGVLSAQPLEDVVIGRDLFLAAVDVGHLPFMLRGLAVQARDAASGAISVGLYRVDAGNILPNRWNALLSGSVDLALDADPAEMCGVLDIDRQIDRTAAAWLVAVLGSTDTVIARGTRSYTSPSFAGWTMHEPGALPASIASGELEWTLAVPSVALLTQSGVRMRGTGRITL
jgi:hypothetical protein